MEATDPKRLHNLPAHNWPGIHPVQRFVFARQPQLITIIILGKRWFVIVLLCSEGEHTGVLKRRTPEPSRSWAERAARLYFSATRIPAFPRQPPTKNFIFL